MGGAEGHSDERILIAITDPAKDTAIHDAIGRQLPGLLIDVAHSVAAVDSYCKARDFDVVILDHDLTAGATIQLLHELKLKDWDPGVLVVASSDNPRVIAELYQAGCHKCIMKDGRWLEEVGPAARHLLRLKRLENENLKLMSKLTEANQLLEEKNRRLDEFSATIAHDIRGPLGGVTMKLEYIIDTMGDKLDPRNKGLMDRALLATQRLGSIVQAMYEYAKLGSKATRMAPVNLTQLVDEMVHDLHFDAARDIKIGIGDLPTVWGSTDLLRRVFINLLSNAVKYNDKDQVIVNISHTGSISKSIGEFVRIEISDNGPGIPERELNSIFTMFSRGSTSHGDSDGAGIGLAVVRRIVDLHFGSIEVTSKPGAGTVFSLLLPRDKVDFIGGHQG